MGVIDGGMNEIGECLCANEEGFKTRPIVVDEGVKEGVPEVFGGDVHHGFGGGGVGEFLGGREFGVDEGPERRIAAAELAFATSCKQGEAKTQGDGRRESGADARGLDRHVKSTQKRKVDERHGMWRAKKRRRGVSAHGG